LPLHAGRVVLITGAARGIGRATAEEFAAQGADVVACDIGVPVFGAQSATAQPSDLEETAELVRALGRRCLVRTVDVRVQATLDEAVADAIAEFGAIDVVVANAGIMHAKPFWETDEQSWSDVLDINLGGVWRTAKAAAPHLIQRRTGSIVATGSVQSHTARKNLAAYTASKHGVLGLVRSMALELGPHNVRVNAVLPGAIHTPMIDNDAAGHVSGQASADDPRTTFFRHMSILRDRSVLPPAAVARAISWLASDGADQITGVGLPVDAGSLIMPGINPAPIID
jgi:SDR family mycofactocin-dependent oxidoreductase